MNSCVCVCVGGWGVGGGGVGGWCVCVCVCVWTCVYVCVSRCGLAVRRYAGKHKDLGFDPLRLSFLLKKKKWFMDTDL